MPKHKVSLTDRYTQLEGRIHLRGSQAMVRLLLMQRARDAAQGLNTAGFVSGYRGSPMTAIDEELWRAGKLLPDNHITFWPGINENLAMTSVWGTQQTNYYNDSTFDGVFGMWYGKGPGWTKPSTACAKATGTAPIVTAACWSAWAMTTI